MVMIPPLLRDPPPDGRQSPTARPVSARMLRTQRRYASNWNIISFTYEPPKPITTFDKWRAAAAEMNLSGGGDPSNPAAHGEAAASGVAVAPRRTLHDVLLGTTTVALVGVLCGIGYLVGSGAVPGTIASGSTVSTGSRVAAVVQPLKDLAAKVVAHTVPEHALSPPPSEAATADVTPPVPQPAASPPVPGPSVAVGEAAPAPEPAAESAPQAKPSEPDMAALAPPRAMPTAPVEVAPLPAPTPATAAVPPAKLPEPDAPPSVPAAEQAVAKAIPPAKPSEPEGAPPVPAIASVTVRLPPAPEWTTVPSATLASLPEAAPPPAPPPAAPPKLPPVPASPAPSAGPTVAPAETARGVPPGVDAQQVVSTMTLVQQMSLMVRDMHDEGLRYRTDVAALTETMQAKASSLEERLKLAEARSAAGAGAEAGGLPAFNAAAGAPQVLRGYRVQAGSSDAAVLTDVSAGPERAARLLVMVGDQLPGAGRVTAIVQRGRAWIVRTERGVIQ